MRTEHKRACKRSSQESAATSATRFPGGLELEPWQTQLLAAFADDAPWRVCVYQRGRRNGLLMLIEHVRSLMPNVHVVSASPLEAHRAYRATIAALAEHGIEPYLREAAEAAPTAQENGRRG